MCYERVEFFRWNALRNLILLVPLMGMEAVMGYTAVLVSGSSYLLA